MLYTIAGHIIPFEFTWVSSELLPSDIALQYYELLDPETACVYLWNHVP